MSRAGASPNAPPPDPAEPRLHAVERQLERARAQLERLSAAGKEELAERQRLQLRILELGNALQEKQNEFLGMLDRLQEREEHAVQRALREVAKSEERFRVLVESITDAFFALDREWRFTYVNRRAEELLGKPREQLLGRNIWEQFPDAIGSTFYEEYHLAREEQRTVQFQEYFAPLDMWVDVRAYPSDGTLSVYFQDVTERVEYQQALEKTTAKLGSALEELRIRTKEAEVASQAKSDFLAVMSHELRTPLNAILGYTNLMELGVPEPIPDASKVHVGRVQSSAHHLLHLIDEILTFSRIEAGREEVRTEPLDLAELVRETAELVEPLAQGKNLTLHIRTPAEPITMVTDSGKVRQILLNLTSNAIKFTEKGEVEVTAESRPGEVVLQVRDTGVGIAPGQFDRIFEPFRQAEEPTTRRKGGTGLGLSVTRSLAELLGGTISVDSTPGKGTTFTVRLPRNVEPTPAESG